MKLVVLSAAAFPKASRRTASYSLLAATTQEAAPRSSCLPLSCFKSNQQAKYTKHECIRLNVWDARKGKEALLQLPKHPSGSSTATLLDVIGSTPHEDSWSGSEWPVEWLRRQGLPESFCSVDHTTVAAAVWPVASSHCCSAGNQLAVKALWSTQHAGHLLVGVRQHAVLDPKGSSTGSWVWTLLTISQSQESIVVRPTAHDLLPLMPQSTKAAHSGLRIASVMMAPQSSGAAVALAVSDVEGSSVVIVLDRELQLVWSKCWQPGPVQNAGTEASPAGRISSIAWLAGTHCMAVIDTFGNLGVLSPAAAPLTLQLHDVAHRELDQHDQTCIPYYAMLHHAARQQRQQQHGQQAHLGPKGSTFSVCSMGAARAGSEEMKSMGNGLASDFLLLVSDGCTVITLCYQPPPLQLLPAVSSRALLGAGSAYQSAARAQKSPSSKMTAGIVTLGMPQMPLGSTLLAHSASRAGDEEDEDHGWRVVWKQLCEARTGDLAGRRSHGNLMTQFSMRHLRQHSTFDNPTAADDNVYTLEASTLGHLLKGDLALLEGQTKASLAHYASAHIFGFLPCLLVLLQMKQLAAALALLRAFSSFICGLPVHDLASLGAVQMQQQWRDTMRSCLQQFLTTAPLASSTAAVGDGAAAGQHLSTGPKLGAADKQANHDMTNDRGRDQGLHAAVSIDSKGIFSRPAVVRVVADFVPSAGINPRVSWPQAVDAEWSPAVLLSAALSQLSVACQCLAYLGFTLHGQLAQQRKQRQLQLQQGYKLRPSTRDFGSETSTPRKSQIPRRSSFKSPSSSTTHASRSLSMMRLRDSMHNRAAREESTLPNIVGVPMPVVWHPELPVSDSLLPTSGDPEDSLTASAARCKLKLCHAAFDVAGLLPANYTLVASAQSSPDRHYMAKYSPSNNSTNSGSNYVIRPSAAGQLDMLCSPAFAAGLLLMSHACQAQVASDQQLGELQLILPSLHTGTAATAQRAMPNINWQLLSSCPSAASSAALWKELGDWRKAAVLAFAVHFILSQGSSKGDRASDSTTITSVPPLGAWTHHHARLNVLPGSCLHIGWSILEEQVPKVQKMEIQEACRTLHELVAIPLHMLGADSQVYTFLLQEVSGKLMDLLPKRFCITPLLPAPTSDPSLLLKCGHSDIRQQLLRHLGASLATTFDELQLAHECSGSSTAADEVVRQMFTHPETEACIKMLLRWQGLYDKSALNDALDNMCMCVNEVMLSSPSDWEAATFLASLESAANSAGLMSPQDLAAALQFTMEALNPGMDTEPVLVDMDDLALVVDMSQLAGTLLSCLQGNAAAALELLPQAVEDALVEHQRCYGYFDKDGGFDMAVAAVAQAALVELAIRQQEQVPAVGCSSRTSSLQPSVQPACSALQPTISGYFQQLLCMDWSFCCRVHVATLLHELRRALEQLQQRQRRNSVSERTSRAMSHGGLNAAATAAAVAGNASWNQGHILHVQVLLLQWTAALVDADRYHAETELQATTHAVLSSIPGCPALSARVQEIDTALRQRNILNAKLTEQINRLKQICAEQEAGSDARASPTTRPSHSQGSGTPPPGGAQAGAGVTLKGQAILDPVKTSRQLQQAMVAALQNYALGSYHDPDAPQDPAGSPRSALMAGPKFSSLLQCILSAVETHPQQFALSSKRGSKGVHHDLHTCFMNPLKDFVQPGASADPQQELVSLLSVSSWSETLTAANTWMPASPSRSNQAPRESGSWAASTSPRMLHRSDTPTRSVATPSSAAGTAPAPASQDYLSTSNRDGREGGEQASPLTCSSASSYANPLLHRLADASSMGAGQGGAGPSRLSPRLLGSQDRGPDSAGSVHLTDYLRYDSGASSQPGSPRVSEACSVHSNRVDSMGTDTPRSTNNPLFTPYSSSKAKRSLHMG